ncbi:MAG: complement resistance protein TraT [Zhongshania sp.]|uniref:complement resistance protein TraT n=1 Tax=Zhongshania sp. TaxID=1971902 RepID=UPI00262057F7|nr:complement resistance protein TraT [Zhongshania sp.]MDF1692380.1 complement resistance protein TraT [Zhongshania sp.]
MKHILSYAYILAGLLSLSLLSGCAATSVALGKKDLEVQTKTSTSVFVDPVSRDKRTVYLDVRSGVMEFDRNAFTRVIREQFAASDKGYRIVDDPDQAHFQMLVYVLNLEEGNLSAAQSALQEGYVGGGEALAGGAVGAVIGANRGHGWGGAALGAVAASGLSMVANALVKDVTFMLVCDISIRERVADGVYVRRDTQLNNQASDSGSSMSRVSEVTDRKDYRTRIVTTANKANLELVEAQESMFQKTAYAMAGFF